MHTIADHEIKRLLAARQGLVEDFRVYGIRPATDLDFFASGLPDEEALYELWKHVQELAQRSSRNPTEACDVLNQVISARDNYDLEIRNRGSTQIHLNRDLAAIAKARHTCEIIALLDRRLADPQRGPALLVALWQGAVAAKLARDADWQVEAPNVKIKGKCTSVRGDSESALRRLAEDPVAFAAAARRALDLHKILKSSGRPSAHMDHGADDDRPRRRDWLRPLRDLIDDPNRRRFEALVRQGDDDKDQKVYLPALRRAARRLFGGSLAATWRRHVAADPEKIKAVARGALEFLKLGTRASGPPRDLARDMYVTRLSEIYLGLTGKQLTYNTAWPSSKLGRKRRRYGLALTFVQLGLRLIDPGVSEHQARDCIDQHRERSRKAKNT